MNRVTAKRAAGLQRRIEDLLNRLIDEGFERGVQVAVYLGGAPVVDVAVGTVADGSGRKVDSDTLFPVCSTGKGVLASIVHVLAERGVVDYGRPIAEYWPEFGANGKGAITVRQALAHQAGIPLPPPFASMDEACDFEAACARVAGLVPQWPAGSTMQYHSRTFGWIVGGLAEKAAGRPLKQLLLDCVTRPLGIAESLFFGISEEADPRFTPFEAQPVQQEQCTTAPSTNAPPPPGTSSELAMPLRDFVGLPKVRRCCMPAVNGIMSAKALAKHYAALMGDVDGFRLIAPERLQLATVRVTQEGTTPLCFGHGFGLGYCLKGPASDMGAFFGHGGAGGSEGMANQRLNMALALTKNRMDTHVAAPNHTHWMVINAIHDTLGHAGDGGFYNTCT